MKSKLKSFIGYFLWEIGVRSLIPNYFLNKIEICENNEPLVDISDKFSCGQKPLWVRSAVAKHLIFAQESMPPGYKLHIIYGFRSMAEQSKLYYAKLDENKNKFPKLSVDEISDITQKQVSNPHSANSPHMTGGAVDVCLMHDGKMVDMGGEWNGENAKTFGRPIPRAAKNNRKILYCAMKRAGFINYPLEWWHWSWGDKIWAAYGGQKTAVYDKILW